MVKYYPIEPTNMQHNSIRRIALYCIIPLFLGNCQREVPKSKISTGTYMKVFSKPENQFGRYIKPTSDGGMLLFQNEENEPGYAWTLVVKKTNAFGEVQWEDIYKGDMLKGIFTPLENGNTLFSSEDKQGNLLLFDMEGKLVFKNQYSKDQNYLYSQAIEIDNSIAYKGCYLVSKCNGVYGGIDNYIFKMKPNGTFLNVITLQNDVEIKGKVLNFKPYAFVDHNTYYIFGQHLPKPNWTWNDCEQTFVTKIEYDTKLRSTRTVTLDPQNVNFYCDGYSSGKHLTYPDNGVLLAINQYYWANGNNRAHFFRVDKDLNLLWEKDLLLENAKGCKVNSMVRCSDGSLLFSGWIVLKNQKITQPFICKTDDQINVLWQRVFNSGLGGAANHAAELLDGSIAVTGETISFSEGVGFNDVFLYKTDRYGGIN